VFFREASPAQRVFLQKRAAARRGVVQPVGHLTVNAHEAILQGRAPERSSAKIACIHAALGNIVPGNTAHFDAGNRKPN